MSRDNKAQKSTYSDPKTSYNNRKVNNRKDKVFTGVFAQCGRRVSKVMVRVRVSVKIRIRFRFIYVGDPTCSHNLAV